MKNPNQTLRKRSLDEYNKNPNTCLFCDNGILVKSHEKVADVRKRKFCNPSCNASYQNSLSPKKKKKEKRCLFCSSILEKNVNKFCSISCSVEHTWETKHLPRILKGKCKHRRTLRNFLIRRDGDICAVCKLSDWVGDPITLEVDHIDGDASNDYPDNLRLLCPNCHSQTEYFCGRNLGRGRKSRGISKG